MEDWSGGLVWQWRTTCCVVVVVIAFIFITSPSGRQVVVVSLKRFFDTTQEEGATETGATEEVADKVGAAAAAEEQESEKDDKRRGYELRFETIPYIVLLLLFRLLCLSSMKLQLALVLRITELVGVVFSAVAAGGRLASSHFPAKAAQLHLPALAIL